MNLYFVAIDVVDRTAGLHSAESLLSDGVV